jgi:hypothetical protein
VDIRGVHAGMAASDLYPIVVTINHNSGTMRSVPFREIGNDIQREWSKGS